MAKSPTAEDVPTVAVQGERPVATYNPAVLTPGVNALVQGGQHLGAGVEAAGKDVFSVEQLKAHSQYYDSLNNGLADNSSIYEKYRNDPDPGTTLDRFDKESAKTIQDIAATVEHPVLRDKLSGRLGRSFAISRAKLEQDVFTKNRDLVHTDLTNDQQDIWNKTGPYDDINHNERMDAFTAKAQMTAANGLLKPHEANAILRQTANGVAAAHYDAIAVKGTPADRARAIAELTNGSQVGADDYAARVAKLDGGDPLAKFSPEQLRHYGVNAATAKDPAVRQQAIALQARDNGEAIYNGLGRPATDPELYLARQVGPDAAVAILKNPGASALAAVRPAFPSDEAARKAVGEAIAGNQALKGATADTVTAKQLAEASEARYKAAPAEPGKGSILDLMTPQQKWTVLSRLQDAQRRDAAHNDAKVGQQVGLAALSASRGGNFAPSTAGAITTVAARYGIDAGNLARTVQIESGGNPRAQTGSYKGLTQLSDSEWQKYKPRADASIWNPADNLEAGAAKMKAEGDQFAKNFGRQPSGFDSYMIHQQGLAGYSSHLANPNAPAWQNMLSTGEGRQKGDAWARAAIWGNIPDQYKAMFGNVNNVTSRDFLAMWEQKWGLGGASGGGAGGGGGGGPASIGVGGAASGPTFVRTSFNETPQQEGRGNFENAAFPRANLAAASKADAYRHVLDNPNLTYEQQQHALHTIDQRLKVEEIAENQTTQAKKTAVDHVAGNYTTEIWDGMHKPGFDWVDLAGRINHDPALADAHELREKLLERVAKRSGEEQSLMYGAGFLDVKRAVLSAPGTPGHLGSMADVYQLPTDTLTAAGEHEIAQVLAAVKKSPDAAAVERTKLSLITYAKQNLSFDGEFAFPGMPPKRDLKGEEVFNGVFVPKFEAAYSQWLKEGKDPWAFLTRQNVDKLMEGLRSKSEMNAARIAATGEATGEKGAAPKEPVPPTPEGVNPAGWVPIMHAPPVTASGKPWPMKNWADMLNALRADPSEENRQAFDDRFGILGLKADEVLAKLAPGKAGEGEGAAASPDGGGLLSRARAVVTGAASRFVEGERAKRRAAEDDIAAPAAEPNFDLAQPNPSSGTTPTGPPAPMPAAGSMEGGGSSGAPPAEAADTGERLAIERQLADLDRQQAEAEALPNGKERRQRLSRIEANRAMFKQKLDALRPATSAGPPLDHGVHAKWRESP